jgi:hypothetical protein
MLLTRWLAQPRVVLAALAGALVVCSLVVLPQGQALASALVVFFRGQTIQPVATDYAHLQNGYRALEELEKLGALQGRLPTQLSTVSSTTAAGSMAGFTIAQPGTLPSGMPRTPTAVKALAPSQVILTLSAATADAYFASIGSGRTLPAALDGEQLIVNFPGVALCEYAAPTSGKLYIGQAGQLSVEVAGNATVDELRQYLLTLPGLSPDTAAALQSISNWQTTIPLGIPTDRAGWNAITVGGHLGGPGVALNDNTGIGSAVVWQQSNGLQSFGVGGWGIKANDVQAVANSLQ